MPGPPCWQEGTDSERLMDVAKIEYEARVVLAIVWGDMIRLVTAWTGNNVTDPLHPIVSPAMHCLRRGGNTSPRRLRIERTVSACFGEQPGPTRPGDGLLIAAAVRATGSARRRDGPGCEAREVQVHESVSRVAQIDLRRKSDVWVPWTEFKRIKTQELRGEQQGARRSLSDELLPLRRRLSSLLLSRRP